MIGPGWRLPGSEGGRGSHHRRGRCRPSTCLRTPIGAGREQPAGARSASERATTASRRRGGPTGRAARVPETGCGPGALTQGLRHGVLPRPELRGNRSSVSCRGAWLAAKQERLRAVSDQVEPAKGGSHADRGPGDGRLIRRENADRPKRTTASAFDTEFAKRSRSYAERNYITIALVAKSVGNTHGRERRDGRQEFSAADARRCTRMGHGGDGLARLAVADGVRFAARQFVGLMHICTADNRNLRGPRRLSGEPSGHRAAPACGQAPRHGGDGNQARFSTRRRCGGPRSRGARSGPGTARKLRGPPWPSALPPCCNASPCIRQTPAPECGFPRRPSIADPQATASDIQLRLVAATPRCVHRRASVAEYFLPVGEVPARTSGMRCLLGRGRWRYVDAGQGRIAADLVYGPTISGPPPTAPIPAADTRGARIQTGSPVQSCWSSQTFLPGRLDYPVRAAARPRTRLRRDPWAGHHVGARPCLTARLRPTPALSVSTGPRGNSPCALLWSPPVPPCGHEPWPPAGALVPRRTVRHTLQQPPIEVCMPFSLGASARLLAAALVVAGLSTGAVLAETAAPASQPAADPVVATVNGQPIHLSDVKSAAASMGAEAHGHVAGRDVSAAADPVDRRPRPGDRGEEGRAGQGPRRAAADRGRQGARAGNRRAAQGARVPRSPKRR